MQIDTIFLNQKDLADFSAANNNIDVNLYRAFILPAQQNYIEKVIGKDLHNELQRLIYIDLLNPKIVGVITANSLNVTFQEGSLIAVGDELQGIDILNNTKIKTFDSGTGSTGTYNIEIEGNATKLQTLTSREYELINDNVRLLRMIKAPLVLYMLYDALPFIWARIGANGVNVNVGSGYNNIEYKDVISMRFDIKTQAELAIAKLKQFLEDNYLLYPLYVKEDTTCGKEKRKTLMYGVILD